MYNKSGIFDYYVGDSFVHSINPVCKIISCLFMVVFLIISNSVIDFVLIFLFVLVMVVLSDIGVRVYFNNLRVCFWWLFVLMVVSFVISGSLGFAFFVFLRCVFLVIYFSLMVMSSSFNSIVYGIRKCLWFLEGVLPVSQIALDVGFICKFVNIFYNENLRIIDSKELRGVIYRDMRFWDRFRDFFSRGGIVWKNSIIRLRRIKEVMLVRNYGCFSWRTNYGLNKFGKADTILLGINVVVFVLIVVY